MRTVDEHLAAVLALARPLEPVEVDLTDAFGLVLSDDVVARYPVPPFDNSAMDGFAVRTLDLASAPRRLRVTEDIPAGDIEPHSIGQGEAARIMTGAPLPMGADAVVPVEQTDIPIGPGPLPLSVEVRAAASAGQHIRRIGEDVRVGDTVLRSGSVATPAAVAAAASAGFGRLRVIRRPRVLVIATGAELERPGEAIVHGQIPDSNSALLVGLLRQFGADTRARTTSDDPAEFRAALDDAADSDLVLTTGGVSVGAYEVVRQVARASVDFVRVAMQPGKPQGVGRVGGVPLLAFPGNPVSAFVSAWLFARPLIAALAGRDTSTPWRSLRAEQGWSTPPGRAQYLPVLIGDGVRPAHGLGSSSHAIASLHLANGLARVTAEVGAVSPGDLVEVIVTDG